MKYLRSIIRIACQRHVALASLQIALVVGAILNLINQGDAVWTGQSFSLGQFVLNFAVPFCVASYSAAKNEMKLRRWSQDLQRKLSPSHEENADLA